MAKVPSTQRGWLEMGINAYNKTRQDVYDFFLVHLGMPGPLHSVEPVGHTWVGSSQPLRRT